MNRIPFLFAAALAAIFPQRAQSVEATAADFSKSFPVTASFDLGTETLADFPVLVRLSKSSIEGFSYADFQQENGADLRFFDDGGAVLSHEIQLWDPEGESLVWVKIPALTADTVFHVAYGTELEVTNNPEDTWSAYEGAWHFDEGETAGTSYDSTSNHFNGDNAAGVTDAEGIVGRARENALGGIILPTTANWPLGTRFAFSGWFYHNPGGCSWDHMFYRKNASSDAKGFASELNDKKLDTVDVFGSGNNKVQISTGLTEENWHHITLVYDSSLAGNHKVSFYNNGVLRSSRDLWGNGASESTLPIAFGTDSDRNDGSIWRGRLDEFRMRKVIPSAAWIAAEYATVADASTLSYGTVSSEAALYFLDTTAISWTAADGFVISTELASGTANLSLVLPDAELSTPIATGATNGQVYTAALPELAANTTYSYYVFATNTTSGATKMGFNTDASTLYTGEIAVETLLNGAYDIGRPASFAITRPATPDACRYELAVYYSLGGNAVAGTDYAPTSGKVILPAGEYNTIVQIPVLEGVNNGATLTLSLLPGPYKTGDSATASAYLFESSSGRSDYSPNDFTHQVMIRSAVELDGATLENFPVLVRLGSHIEGFSYDDVLLPNGSDLCFFDANGYVLPYEVELWNPEGESLVWVLAPSFAKDTLLYMCYGRTSPTVNSPYEVWDDYTGVWHLDGADANQLSPDSTANGYSAHNGSLLTDGEGVVAGARYVPAGAAAGDQGILIRGSEEIVLGPNFAMSGWIYHEGSTSWDHLFYRKEKSGDQKGFASEINDKDLGKIRIFSRYTDSRDINSGFSNNRWHYVTLAYTGRNVRLYTDGVLREDYTYGNTLLESSLPITIGCNSTRSDSPWKGRFDEIRLRLDTDNVGARSSADYQIMNRSDSLLYDPATSTTAPLLNGVPEIKHAGEKLFTVSTELISGLGELLIVCNDTVTNSLSAGIVSGPRAYTDIPIVGLADNTCYTAALITTNGNGNITRLDNEIAFLTGTVSAQVAIHVQACHVFDGAFTVSRPDTDAACQHDLIVNYTLSGTAEVGVDYKDTLSGTVVIPAGAASVTLPVYALPTVRPDVTLTLTLTDGFYDTDATSTATLDFDGTSFLDNYTLRVPITVQGITDEAAAPLVDFPVLVRLGPTTIANFRYSTFREADGSDLAFATPEGRILPHEIDTWNPAGESLVWVKVPSVATGTLFYAYCGADLALVERIGRDAPATDTWSDYIGVWHLNDSGDAGAPVADSTAFEHNGFAGPYGSASSEGIVGTSRRISDGHGNGSEKGNITIPYKPTLNGISGNYTASWWFYGYAVNGWNYFMGRKQGDKTSGWALQMENTAQKLRFRYETEDKYETIEFKQAVEPNRWYKMTAIFEASGNRYVSVYIDGVQQNRKQTWSWPDNNTEPLFIGGPGTGYGSFNGLMDEVRLRSSVVSGAWVQAEYLQETNPSFLEYGPIEPMQPATLILFR